MGATEKESRLPATDDEDEEEEDEKQGEDDAGWRGGVRGAARIKRRTTA